MCSCLGGHRGNHEEMAGKHTTRDLGWCIYIYIDYFQDSWNHGIFYEELDEVEQIRAAGPQEEIFKVPNVVFRQRERCGKNRIFQQVLQAFFYSSITQMIPISSIGILPSNIVKRKIACLISSSVVKMVFSPSTMSKVMLWWFKHTT